MRSDSIRLFHTLEHRCGYYAELSARNLVLDPVSPQLAELYHQALVRGFRRAGGHVYRPHCVHCQACTPCRVAVAQFKPSRSQQRAARANSGVQVSLEQARCSVEFLELYQRYLQSRHSGGGMDQAQAEDFSQFLYSPWSDTRFLTLREDGQLLAVAVTDVTRFGLSAVYTFFNPDLTRRSLGTVAILEQIALARRMGLEHLYLGYWIDGHPKMDYKRLWQPLEVLRDNRWLPWSTLQRADG
jgi:arginine-tRNA-protein transferase